MTIPPKPRLNVTAVRRKSNLWLIVVGMLTSAALTGCGSSGPPSDAATATCLRNALANEALHAAGSCAASTAAAVESERAVGSSGRFTVGCTHQNGDVYVCHVTVPTVDGINVSGIQAGFYDVTFDGQSIVFQTSTG